MLGALSLYNTSFLPTTELYESLNLDLTHGKRPDAYTKRSEALQHYSTGLQAFQLPNRLEISEAAGIFDAWIKDRALHTSTIFSWRNSDADVPFLQIHRTNYSSPSIASQMAMRESSYGEVLCGH
jgi:hypothetical protein